MHLVRMPWINLHIERALSPLSTHSSFMAISLAELGSIYDISQSCQGMHSICKIVLTELEMPRDDFYCEDWYWRVCRNCLCKISCGKRCRGRRLRRMHEPFHSQPNPEGLKRYKKDNARWARYVVDHTDAEGTHQSRFPLWLRPPLFGIR